jgi:hypothetical protein
MYDLKSCPQPSELNIISNLQKKQSQALDYQSALDLLNMQISKPIMEALDQMVLGIC